MKFAKTLFGGAGATRRQQVQDQAKRDSEQRVAQAKQEEALQNQQAEQEGGLARARRAKRGQRLLIASETGKSTLG